MKSKNKKLIVALCAIVVVLASFTAVFYWESEKNNVKPEVAKEKIREPGVEYLEKELNFPDPILKEYDEYLNVYVNESDLNSISDSRPILPVNLTIIEFPFGTKIKSVDYEISNPEIISIKKKIAYGQYSPRETVMDKDIYENSELYPSDWVTYHTGGGLSNDTHKTFLVIRVYPVRYLPLEDQLHYIKKIKIEISYKEPEKNILKEKDDYDLLIITPSSFSKSLQPLVVHKNNIGIKTILVKLPDIYNKMSSKGRDDPEKIKYYIKEAIETWGVKYVLLVGGIKGISSKWNLPPRYSHVVPMKEQEEPEESFLSDLYYADIYDSSGNFSSWDTNKNDIFAEWNENGIDKMDLYPDVYLGRLACINNLEVKTVVKKIINYEKEKVSSKAWFKNLVLVAGDSYDDENGFIEGELICDEAIKLLPDFNPIEIYASETTINGKIINKALNQGAGFVYFCGHGAVAMWGTHYPPEGTRWTDFFTNKNINQLRNKEKLPVAVIGGCFNAKFDVSIMNNLKKGIRENGLKYILFKFWQSGLTTRCLAWKLTVKNGGGSIATIANTGLGTHGREDKDHNGIPDHNEVIDGWLELRFFELYGTKGKDILGENHGQTITEYLHRFLGNVDKMDVKMVQQWELFGDPSLKIGGY